MWAAGRSWTRRRWDQGSRDCREIKIFSTVAHAGVHDEFWACAEQNDSQESWFAILAC